MVNISTDTPLVQCLEVRAEAPSLQDNTADIDRLKLALQAVLIESGQEHLECKVPFKALPKVAEMFRNCNFQGGAIVNFHPGVAEIVDFVPDVTGQVLAIALDLGTTHLEATLLNLADGESLATSHTLNRQVGTGPDILSRIHHAVRVVRGKEMDFSGLEELSRMWLIPLMNWLWSLLTRPG